MGGVVRELVRPGARVLAVTEHYGYPLEYDAWVPVCFWLTRADAPIMVRAGVLPSPFTADGYLRHLIADRGCEFAVVTDLAEYDGQPELRAALARRGRLVRSSPGLLVFDLRPGR